MPQRFTFVNVSAPQDAKTENNKKRIRSAAASSGWAQGSRPTQGRDCDESLRLETHVDLSRVDIFDSQVSGSSSPRPKPPLYSRSPTDSKRKPSLSSVSDPDPSAEPFGPDPKPDQDFAQNEDYKFTFVSSWEVENRSGSPKPQPANVKRKRIARRKTPIPPVPSKSPSPVDLGSGSKDVFNLYPIPSQPWVEVDRVLHHMLTVFAPRGWPSLGISTVEGLSWERFMTQHALAEPALFNVRLLFASGDLIRLKVMRPEVSLYLRDQAVKAINKALSDPQRAISDPLILAVGRIALHESMYGDRSAANLIHRPAQHRMIMLRGGMGALDFPGLVKRLMRWADRVMSMQSDTPRFLPDDDKSFSLGQSVDVLEHWVPQQGSSLRQKYITHRGLVQ